MARQLVGIALLAVSFGGLVAEFVVMRELWDADYFYSHDRGPTLGAEAWVLLVGALTFGVALLGAASGSSRRFLT